MVKLKDLNSIHYIQPISQKKHKDTAGFAFTATDFAEGEVTFAKVRIEKERKKGTVNEYGEDGYIKSNQAKS